MKKINIEQLLIDAGITFKKEDTVYKGSPCTKYKLDECLFNPDHKDNDACFFQYENGAVVYKCFHNSCKDNKWKQAKELIRENYNINAKDYWNDSKDKAQIKKGREGITYLSAEEVLKTPVKNEWLITNLIALHESILIHAKGGLGKSMFVLFLALAVASFRDRLNSFVNGFLGDKFFIPRRRCFVSLGAENGRVTTYQRLEKMCGSGDFEEGLKNIFFLSQYNDTTITGNFFNDESFCDFLVEYIQQIEQEQDVKIEVIIIDPLISFSGVKNENDSAEMRPALDAIDRVCKQVQCTPIVVHHDKKDGNGYRGASAVNDWTRNRISLTSETIAEERITDQDKDGTVTGKRVQKIPVIRVTHEKCNNFKMFEPFLIRMNRNLHFERVEEQMSAKHVEKVNIVVQALTDMGGFAESTNALATVCRELSGISKPTAKRDIKLAVDNGRITMKPVVKKGTTTYEYSLP